MEDSVTVFPWAQTLASGIIIAIVSLLIEYFIFQSRHIMNLSKRMSKTGKPVTSKKEQDATGIESSTDLTVQRLQSQLATLKREHQVAKQQWDGSIEEVQRSRLATSIRTLESQIVEKEAEINKMNSKFC